MAELQAGHGALASLEAYIAALNELEPSNRRFAVAALLAPRIGRVRLFRSNGNALAAVAECAMSPNTEGGGFWSDVSNATGVPRSALATLGTLPNSDIVGAALAPVACIDLVEDDAGNVAVSIGQAPPLEGESLLALGEQGAAPLPASSASPPPAGSFLSAAGAAALLGVAKSTVTRKIDKNEVIGFRTFTNALRVPKEQFMHGNVVAGIPQILAMFADESSDGKRFADHRGAWDFLTMAVYPGDTAPRPIDRLKAGMRNRKSRDVVAELGRVKESLDYGDHV